MPAVCKWCGERIGPDSRTVTASRDSGDAYFAHAECFDSMIYEGDASTAEILAVDDGPPREQPDELSRAYARESAVSLSWPGSADLRRVEEALTDLLGGVA